VSTHHVAAKMCMSDDRVLKQASSRQVGISEIHLTHSNHAVTLVAVQLQAAIKSNLTNTS